LKVFYVVYYLLPLFLFGVELPALSEYGEMLELRLNNNKLISLPAFFPLGLKTLDLGHNMITSYAYVDTASSPLEPALY
jgi:Leucine-rich repeat (LRR) protein